MQAQRQNLLNETNFSIPGKGIFGARGFDTLETMDPGYVITMAKLAVPLHYLATAKTIFVDNADNNSYMMIPKCLESESEIERILNVGKLTSADHFADTHDWLDDIQGQSYPTLCEKVVSDVANKLLLASNKPFEYDSILVFTNSGLGASSDGTTMVLLEMPMVLEWE